MDNTNNVDGAHKFTLITLGIAILCACLLVFIQVPQIIAQTSGTSLVNCPTGFTLGVNNTAGTVSGSTPIIGPANLMFGATVATPSPINKVMFTGNGIPLGRAQSTSAYSWSMPWITALMPNGSVNLTAVITFANGTQCKTNNLSVTVQNPTQNMLGVDVQPSGWSGPMSFSFPVNAVVRVPEMNFDATPYALYTWTSTIGSVISNGQQAQYSSGQTVGSGSIKVLVQYGGKSIERLIPISVANTAAPLPTTNNNTTTTGTNNNTSLPTTTTSTVPGTSSSTTTPSTTSTTSATQQLVTQRAATLQNNPTAQGCAITALGKERFDAINSGGARPSPDELKKLSICFAASNYILPSNFAPVAPAEITKLPTATTVKIANLVNDQKTNDSGKTDTLKLSGKAAPNTTVVIYIFSDPLVLTTTTNENGDWSYTLENPIEPGKHEVYAVVDKGDGTYEKSSPFDFVIGTAVAADNNPEGLSLKLASDPTPKQSNRTLMLFIGASIAIVVSVIVGLVIVIKRKRRPQSVTVNTPAANYQPQTATNPASVPTVGTFVPTQPSNVNSGEAVVSVVQNDSQDQSTPKA